MQCSFLSSLCKRDEDGIWFDFIHSLQIMAAIELKAIWFDFIDSLQVMAAIEVKAEMGSS